MPSSRVAPWRTGLPGRPAVPVPPQRMPPLRRGRPLKRWRWVGAFGDDVMLCAAVAHVGPAPVSWWAVWDRRRRLLHERTTRRSGPVTFGAGGRVSIRDGAARADLRIHERDGVETISPHGGAHVWTRKQGGVEVSGTVTVGGTAHRVDARGIVDDSAGYHARHTAWWWSAGVGTTADGAAVAWNLVHGLHDAAAASERTIWVDGAPHEVGPVTFAPDLTRLDFAEGPHLTFAAEARRARRDRLLLVSSNYEQPFGTFAGALPVAGALREGRGVMERHRARW